MKKTAWQAAWRLGFQSAALGALLVLACAPALAERADKAKPINLEADSLRFDDAKQMTVVEGAVVLTKGTLVIRAARVEVRSDAQGNQSMIATGTTTAATTAATGAVKASERVFFRQKREGLDEFMEGEAQQIEYDSKLDTVKLIGSAVMRRLRGATLADESSGHLIVFNNANETLSLNGSPAVGGASPQRVRMMLSPK